MYIYTGQSVISYCKKRDQSITVLFTGESGAGKSENTNHLLNYICHYMSSANLKLGLSSINPVLEIFGNAKTQHNHNSSRFTKFIKVCEFNWNINIVTMFNSIILSYSNLLYFHFHSWTTTNSTSLPQASPIISWKRVASASKMKEKPTFTYFTYSLKRHQVL